jgi:hypothetical protein
MGEATMDEMKAFIKVTMSLLSNNVSYMLTLYGRIFKEMFRSLWICGRQVMDMPFWQLSCTISQTHMSLVSCQWLFIT